MSHRIELKSEMTDENILRDALDTNNIKYSRTGTTFRILSGEANNAVVDTRNGSISGDSDYGHDHSNIGLLRQMYATQKIRSDVARRGGSVTTQTKLANGDLRIVARLG